MSLPKPIFCSLRNEVGKGAKWVLKLTGCIKRHWEKGVVPALEDYRHLFCIYAYLTDGMQKEQSFSWCKRVQTFACAEDLLHGLCLILPGNTLGSNQIVFHIWFWVYSWREMLQFLLFETCIDNNHIYFHLLPYLHLLFCLSFTAVCIRFSHTHQGWKMLLGCTERIGKDPCFSEQGCAATHKLLSDSWGDAEANASFAC